LRSDSPSSLIARILSGRIFPDTNRFVNHYIPLQTADDSADGDRLPPRSSANAGANRFRTRLGCGRATPASRGPDRDSESVATADERSADLVGKGEHRSIAARRWNAFGSVGTSTYASAGRERSRIISNNG